MVPQKARIPGEQDTRAAALAGDLIQNSGVSLIGGSASADNVIPVRDTAKTLG
jgi:hypothetical protein